jgi:autophagy-related protein 2
MLRALAPTARTPTASERGTTSPVAHFRQLVPPASRGAQYVIEDLEASASYATLRANVSHPSDLLMVNCPLIRLDIRCPAPASRRGSWGDGAHLRSGIVTLDLHGLTVGVKRALPASPTGRSSVHPKHTAESSGSVHVEWQKLVLLFCRAPGECLFGQRADVKKNKARPFSS